MSSKAWLIAVIITILLVYGGIFYIRTSFPRYGGADIQCFDIDNEGIPKFADAQIVDLDKIEYIKRYRAGYSLDQPDDFEKCRAMNHYYVPYYEHWYTIQEFEVYSPIDGEIITITQLYANSSEEWKQSTDYSMTEVRIQSSEYPTFEILIRPLDVRNINLKTGMSVISGQHIGYGNMQAIGSVVQSPFVGIIVNVKVCPDNVKKVSYNVKKISYFDIMTDKIFNDYKTRGASSRSEFIISKEERDADPLTCVPFYGEIFLNNFIYEKGNIPNWIYLGKNIDDFEITAEFNPYKI